MKVLVNEYAYPLNTVGKQETMERILGWAKGKGVIGFGRWRSGSIITQM